jgi:hypothetical protein
VRWPWLLRNSDPGNPLILNRAELDAGHGPVIGGAGTLVALAADSGEHPFAWSFHYDDEPPEIVEADLSAASGLLPEADLPPWRSSTTPACGMYMLAPGTVASEAAAITVPVLIGVGERDVVPNPWLEPGAYKSARDVSFFVCPRMAHMHNFATTRELLWQRIHSWGTHVARQRTLAVGL